MKNSVQILFSATLLFGLFLAESPLSHAFGSKAQETAHPTTVWVVRPDGSVGCQKDSGQSLEQGASDLKKAGVTALKSQKISDGQMHIQSCGAPTGLLNAYEIAADDAPRVRTIHFQVATRDNAPGLR